MTVQDVIEAARQLTDEERQELIVALRKMRTHDPEKTHSLKELAGLGAELWKGVDATAYIRALRDESDR